MNENFQSYTRSASFHMTLSQPMIMKLAWYAARENAILTAHDLSTRYDWYMPHDLWPAFGPTTPEELAYECDGTTRALLKRGLVEVSEERLAAGWAVLDAIAESEEPSTVLVFRATTAGQLQAQLLIEAGFDIDLSGDKLVPLVNKHYDDRPRVSVSDADPEPTPRDRRLDLMKPGDEKFFSVGIRDYSRPQHVGA